MAGKISSFRELKAYQAARSLARMIFEESKAWPKEEVYSLTSQIRRSSRAVGAALAEAWAKRSYPAHFLSKLTDADAELQEVCHCIETASECGYFTAAREEELVRAAKEIGRMIGTMMLKHESFCRSRAKGGREI
jgi:four helix bundle protein